MKKLIFTLITILSFVISFAQINKTKIALPKSYSNNDTYDSTVNYLGKNVNMYVGQELYLNERHTSLRNYGYSNFLIDYSKVGAFPGDNIYRCCDGFGSKYNDLAGKYFKVLEVIKHPKASSSNDYKSVYYLKLEEKETMDTLYFYYDYEMLSLYDFPFIVTGYFEKAKKIYFGQKFILRGKSWEENEPEMYDIITGYSVDFSAGTIWKCIDLTIENKNYNLSLIIENSNGIKLTYPINYLLEGFFYAFTKPEADKYKKLYGDKNWQQIMMGKVKIGMTAEMCQLSWGDPKSINKTISSGKKSEQWVYNIGNYLYFENGILIAIQ